MSDRTTYLKKAEKYLNALCGVKPNRRTGSVGNREATDFFAGVVKGWGYEIDATPFPCLDYLSGKASLVSEDGYFEVKISPYSPGCGAAAELVTVTTVEELEQCSCGGKILLMAGPICAEQLMPRNFTFYNPEEHKRIYALLEEKKPAAIVTATTRKPELVGALYPFPLIEDGDFNIPSVYCTERTGERIAERTGELFQLKIEAQRIPSTACNVLARKNTDARQKIVVCAHIDAYGDAPGASDDASGTVVLLLLAEMLKKYKGLWGVEILAINGEDNYTAGGEKDYLRRYGSEMGKILLAVNIDDVGFKDGGNAYSFYECNEEIQRKAREAFGKYPGMIPGEPWYQGDHMVFVQGGRPAIAITSEKMAELMANYTHTEKDTPDIVDCKQLVEAAEAVGAFILKL